MRSSFEKAENARHPAEHARWMTMVVVGGGPTGVELAGTFAELAHTVLRRDFEHIDPTRAHVILIEAGSRVLAAFPPGTLGQRAAPAGPARRRRPDGHPRQGYPRRRG